MELPNWKIFGEGPTEVPEGHFTDTLRKEFTAEDIQFYCKSKLYLRNSIKMAGRWKSRYQSFRNEEYAFESNYQRY